MAMVKGLFGGAAAAPKISPIAPAPRREDAMGAADEAARRLKSASGFTSTIATSPLGLVGGNTATSRSVLGYG
jgi:hypothetical protein